MIDQIEEADEPVELKASYTVDDAKAYVAKYRTEMLENLQNCQEIPAFMRRADSPMVEVWCAGCWMNCMLGAHGATEEQIYEIGFCHGQRSFGRDPYEVGVSYLNEFVSNNAVADKPGAELGDRLLMEQMPELFEVKP